jgi:hypothetical protein
VALSYNVLLVYPRFNADSFWNYQATCDLTGARYPAAPLGLITVAALLPQDWQFRLINKNTEDLTAADLDWADVVMTGGMLPQQVDTLAVIELCRSLGKPVVVGGPDPTSTPHIYERANFLVLGEAEDVIKDFVAAWNAGTREGVFKAPMGEVDVTRSPVPRFDLLKFEQYLHVGIQFSRGCPFVCEFCDIIELYGRVPRTKTSEQVLAELDALYRLGYRGHVDFVDDNLIGNKKAVRKFLPDLSRWLAERKFPFEFSTEASVNLADDPGLLEAMNEANFFAVFVGIESPDTETLVAMQKKQNTRHNLQESIFRIYQAGMFVNAGFIIGFDSERGSVADGMIGCTDDTAIPACMVGLLYALPNTQLTRRLTREGRLFESFERASSSELGDQCTAGLNYETSRPRRDILHDYRTVLDEIYQPHRYFARVRRMGRELDCRKRRIRLPAARWLRDLRATGRLFWRMSTMGRAVRREFFRTVADCLVHNPRALRYVIMTVALYLHFGPFSRKVVEQISRQVAMLDAGTWLRPTVVEGAAVEPERPAAVATVPRPRKRPATQFSLPAALLAPIPSAPGLNSES